MTPESSDRTADEVSHWLGPVLALVVAMASVAGVYAKFSADMAVTNERLLMLEARENVSNTDHDLLIRMDQRLSRIESAVIPAGMK
jgi:hypothetical protein